MTAPTAAQLRALAPSARADLIAAIVDGWPAAEAAGLTTPRRIRHFLARILVETGGLRAIEENLVYSAKRLTQVWPSRFKTLAAAKPYEFQPEKLANFVYGGRMDNDQPGDGWRFRGGGMLQTTGRSGYRTLDLEANPEALRQPVPAFASAVKEWARRGCNALADHDDVAAVCKAINGGTNGLADQRDWLARAAKLFPDEPAGPAYPVLQIGDSGPDVIELQRQLKAAGIDPGGQDGSFGVKTRAAVITLQRRSGLKTDGIADPKTRAALSDRL